MNTELRSEEADCGGVGVLGEVGTEAEAGVSGSASAMLRKVILCGGSLSRGTGWPFRVPEVDVRTGRIPGDFRVYAVFLGCGKKQNRKSTVRRISKVFLCTLKVELELFFLQQNREFSGWLKQLCDYVTIYLMTQPCH